MNIYIEANQPARSSLIAFLQGRTKVSVVTGPSGIGKTTFIRSVLDDRDNQIGVGWFKFDQYAPVESISLLLWQVSQGLIIDDEQVGGTWKGILKDFCQAHFSDPLDDDLILPRLDSNLGNASSQLTMKRRVIDLLSLMSRHSRKSPVIVLDDLQFTDNESIKLLMDIVCDEKIKNVKFILIARSEAEYKDRTKILYDYEESYVDYIKIEPFPPELSRKLISAIKTEDIDPAALESIVDKARGNPLYIVEYLKTLPFEPASDNRSDISDLIKAQILAIPGISLRLLTCAAVMGREVDANSMSRILKMDPTECYDQVQFLGRMDFLITKGKYFSFRHDKIQQACIGLLKDEEINQLRLAIVNAYAQKHIDESFVILVAELAIAVSTSNKHQKIVNSTIVFNCLRTHKYSVPRKMRAILARYLDEYLKAGSDLLNEDQLFAYRIVIAETFYSCEEYADAERVCDQVLSEVRSLESRAIAHEVKCLSLWASGNVNRTIKECINSVNDLGVFFPRSKAGGILLLGKIMKTMFIAKYWSQDKLLSLKISEQIVDSKISTLMTILASVSYSQNAYFLFVSICVLFDHGYKKGFGSGSANGLQMLGNVIFSIVGRDFGNFKKIYRTAMELNNRCGDDQEKNRINFFYQGLFEYYEAPVTENAENTYQTYLNAMRYNDYEVATFAAHCYLYHGLDAFLPIAELINRLNTTYETLSNMGVKNSINWIRSVGSSMVDLVDGERASIDDYEIIKHSRAMMTGQNESGDYTETFVASHFASFFAWMIGDFETAMKQRVIADDFRLRAAGSFGESLNAYYRVLCECEMMLQNKQEIFSIGVWRSLRFLKKGVSMGGVAIKHKYLIARAAICIVKEKYVEALALLGECDKQILKFGGYADQYIMQRYRFMIFRFLGNHDLAEVVLDKMTKILEKWGARTVLEIAIPKLKNEAGSFGTFYDEQRINDAIDAANDLSREFEINTLLQIIESFPGIISVRYDRMNEFLGAEIGTTASLQRKLQEAFEKKQTVTFKHEVFTYFVIPMSLPNDDYILVAKSTLEIPDRVIYKFTELAGATKLRFWISNQEAEIRTLDKESRVQFESVPVGMFTFSLDGTIRRSNNIFTELLGVSSKVYRIDVLSTLVRFESINSLIDFCAGLKDGQKVSVNCESVDKSKQFKVSILCGSLDSRRVYHATMTDITAHREKERVLMELASRSTQLAQVSHEIRSPLSSLTAYNRRMFELEDIGKIKEIAAIQSQVLATIEDSLEAGMITGWIDNASMQQVKRSFSIKDLVNGVILLQEPFAKEKDIRIVFRQAGTDIVKSDNVRIQQILRNLVSNSIRYSKGQLIEIEAGQDAEGKLYFIVSDDGVGMSKDQFAKNLTMWKTSSEAGEGFGLGLSIVSELAQIIGFKLQQFESQLGGATIGIVEVKTALNSDLKPKTLAIDDDASFLNTLANSDCITLITGDARFCELCLEHARDPTIGSILIDYNADPYRGDVIASWFRLIGFPGQIGLMSSVGSLTTKDFLPLAGARYFRSKKSMVNEEYLLDKRKLLVVDDDGFHTDILTSGLANQFEIHSTMNLLEAACALNECFYEYLLCDLNVVNRNDGQMFISLVERDHSMNGTKIIAMSGDGIAVSKICTVGISKPVTASKLERVLASLTTRPANRSGNWNVSVYETFLTNYENLSFDTTAEISLLHRIAHNLSSIAGALKFSVLEWGFSSLESSFEKGISSNDHVKTLSRLHFAFVKKVKIIVTILAPESRNVNSDDFEGVSVDDFMIALRERKLAAKRIAESLTITCADNQSLVEKLSKAHVYLSDFDFDGALCVMENGG